MRTEKKFQLVHNWIFIPVWNDCQNGYFKKPVEINRGKVCLRLLQLGNLAQIRLHLSVLISCKSLFSRFYHFEAASLKTNFKNCGILFSNSFILYFLGVFFEKKWTNERHISKHWGFFVMDFSTLEFCFTRKNSVYCFSVVNCVNWRHNYIPPWWSPLVFWNIH